MQTLLQKLSGACPLHSKGCLPTHDEQYILQDARSAAMCIVWLRGRVNLPVVVVRYGPTANAPTGPPEASIHCSEAEVQIQPNQIYSDQTQAGNQGRPAAVLIVAGLDDSGPCHWQSRWEVLSGFTKVQLSEWQRPRLHEWVAHLDRAIRECPRPLVVAAHSLGCTAAVWWSKRHWHEAFREKVRGLLLVAPPDLDDERLDVRLRDFRPVPAGPVPVRSIVVASRNDPFATFERSHHMARSWRSDFFDAGLAGHINADSRLGEWSEGLKVLARLSGHNSNMLVAEMGLRTVLA